MSQNTVVLKPGKEKALRNRHHWIFSGAIAKKPDFENGDILPVYTAKGDFLGRGYFNNKTSIAGRMLTFDDTEPKQALRNSLEQAIKLRSQIFKVQETNAYRIVNGEGDYLPGLIVDKYDDIVVIQISTKGMDRLRDVIVEILQDLLHPRAIFERSVLPSRKEEGLKDQQGFLTGTSSDEIEIKENGLRFIVSITEGQKTGFFLDHREMRQLVKNLSSGKKVLNCFAYTGGFSVYAAAGGADSIVSVDIASGALELAKRNVDLNQNSKCSHTCVTQDVFHFLRENELAFDLIILDPPAFAKKQKDVIPACRGYKDINRLALMKIPPRSLLLTSSCSYYVDEDLFKKVIFQASVEAKRKVRILESHRQAHDHPINVCHPESEYLKSFLLYIE